MQPKRHNDFAQKLPRTFAGVSTLARRAAVSMSSIICFHGGLLFLYQVEGLIREVRPPLKHSASMLVPHHRHRRGRLFGSSQHAVPRPLETRH